MPKIRNTSLRGLIQESGSGVTFEQGQLTRTLSILTATVDTANGDTSTNLGITPTAGMRCLGYKIEILDATSAPAGNITSLGDAGDADRYSGSITLAAATVGGSKVAAAASAARDADLPATEIAIAHADPGGAGKTSKVRVTLLMESFS